jgi:CDP-glucose 4,6-dehydratase
LRISGNPTTHHGNSGKRGGIIYLNLDGMNIFRNKKVLVTGDTGFKGSWLAAWLIELGAEVFGYSLPPESKDSNYVKIGLENKITHIDGDVRDLQKLKNYFDEVKPDISFHLAAQPIVIESYHNPVFTFETNILGTVNFLEAVRHTTTTNSAVIVTSDKCYQNNDWVWKYRENDPLGGNDPYSASKGCAELITNSYYKSFFANPDSCNIASVRAGNVIGGGDWGKFRIVPDFFRAINNNEKLLIRNPLSTRPWQYVLEPLSGYLSLASKLFTCGKKYTGAWNFGPAGTGNRTVAELITKIADVLGLGGYIVENNISKFTEANLLNLDISKASLLLGWDPVLSFDEIVKFTVDGYKADVSENDIYSDRIRQIKDYSLLAKKISGQQSQLKNNITKL